WGRQSDQEPAPGICRYTPTRVGTTVVCQVQQGSTAVHPHARGDDAARSTIYRKASGTPPRAGGRRRRGLRIAAEARYAPARVGGTSTSSFSISCPAVHPHARGDDAGAYDEDEVYRGTPPRAWGRRFSVIDAFINRRYTPTRVGTTSTTQRKAF